MKKFIWLLFVILYFAVTYSFGQDRKAMYRSLITQADSLYENKEYKLSGATYSAAFALSENNGSSLHKYNAACSFALAGNNDSAFKYLYFIVEHQNYSDYDQTIKDSDLVSIHSDLRWYVLLNKIKDKKIKEEANYNHELVAILDTIYFNDQNQRAIARKNYGKYEITSPEWLKIMRNLEISDSINIVKVTAIIDKYGWLGSDIIGQKGNAALFFVIQHADLNIQEKYFPVMKKASEKGDAPRSALALLEDRISLRNGKRQIYGSQVIRDSATSEFYVAAIDDPDNVDKRRASVGLPPLADYLSGMKIKWDLEQHKRDLPMLDKRLMENKE